MAVASLNQLWLSYRHPVIHPLATFGPVEVVGVVGGDAYWKDYLSDVGVVVVER